MKNKLALYMRLTTLLDNELDKLSKLNSYINQLSNNTKISISTFVTKFDVSDYDAEDILDILCKLDILQKQKVYRCPNCGLLVTDVADISNAKEIICYACNNIDESISKDNIENIYSLKDDNVNRE